MFVSEYPAVYELLELLDVGSCSNQGVRRRVLSVTEDSEEKMVRCNAVASGPHGLFSGIADYRIELV